MAVLARRPGASLWKLFPFMLLAVGLVTFACLSVAVGSIQAAGNHYYVAPTGSDGNPGTLSQPFQTINKCAQIAQASDTCFVRTGTYHETVTPANSGTTSAPISFQPYQGEQVTIDGANPVTGWSLYSGNIYRAAVTLPVSGPQDTGFLANQVFVDGVMMNEARWPNTSLDFLHPTLATAGSGTSTGSIKDSNLPAIDWTGATVVLWEGGDPFVARTATVTSSPAHQLSFSDPCYPGCMGSGNKYFVSGVLGALDSGNEWYYDGSTHELYLWTPSGDNPANHIVEAKQHNLAFDLSGRSSIQISGFHLFAATIITDDNSSNDVLDGLSASYVSHYTTLPNSGPKVSTHETDSGIIIKGTNNIVRNSVITYSAGNGILLAGNNNTATNNLIHDVDYMATYGAGISVIDSGQTATHNTIYNTGRSAITADWGIAGTTQNLPFHNNSIAYNDLSRGTTLTPDGGSIYICCLFDGTGTSIDHNWVHDNAQDLVSTFETAGLYLDGAEQNFLVHHNVIWHTGYAGFQLNGWGSTNSSSTNDLFYNNTVGPGQVQALYQSPPSTITGTRFINNIFYEQYSTGTGGTFANNLPPGTNPQFTNAAAANFHLPSTSPAVDAGQVISGITDGYHGAAPDEGAYELGGADWYPGCSLPGCALDGTISAAQYSTTNGVVNYVTKFGHFDNGLYTGYTGVNFGSSVSSFTASVAVAPAQAGQHIDLHLDSPTGTLIGSLTVQNTGSYSTFTSQSTSVSGASGVHDLYLVARGSSGIASVASFQFTRAATSTVQAAQQIDATNGIHNYTTTLGNFDNGIWVRYSTIDFGSSVSTFTASVSVAPPEAGQHMDLYLDSPTGTLIGSLTVQNTGSYSTFTSQSTSVSGASGVHDLYLVARGSSGVAGIASFQFS